MILGMLPFGESKSRDGRLTASIKSLFERLD